MINVYKSQFSLQWKIPQLKPPQLLLLVLSESCVHFSLKHVLLLFLLLDWTVEEERSELQFTLSPGLFAVTPPPRAAVWLPGAVFLPICCILLWVEWHLLCRFKTGDVFMSLIWVPLTKVTSSSHVGTVCWHRVTDRQISLSVWCYLHVIRVGNEHPQVIKLDWGSDLYLPSSVGQMIS